MPEKHFFFLFGLMLFEKMRHGAGGKGLALENRALLGTNAETGKGKH